MLTRKKRESRKSRRLSLLLPKESAARVIISRSTGVVSLPPKSIQRLYGRILKEFSIANKDIELHLVTSEVMKDLNWRFRQKNKTTDVLSFNSRDASLLGSIVVDVAVASVQAKVYKHSLQREIYDLFIHGTLHLLGLDHHTRRDALQMKQYEDFFGSLLDQVDPEGQK